MIERVMNRVEVDDDVIMNWRPRVNSSSQLNRIPRNVIGLIVNDNSCNDLRELDLSRFEMLESIEIGSNALKNVKNVSMNGLNELKSIEIGNGGLIGVERVDIGSNSLNSISSFDFSLFSNLKVIEIGHESMNQVVNVTANRLGMLQNMRIDDDSLKNTRK